jgi:hypothetical protein
VAADVVLTLYEHPSDSQAPFRLHRLVEWAGFKWEDFRHIRSEAPPSDTVILAMGQQAQELTTDVKRHILDSRGYIYSGASSYVIPTVHPAFIQRGNARWSAAFINDLQKAVALAKGGYPPQVADYVLDPSPLVAYQWAQGYRERLRLHGGLRLAFDIETPGKGDDEDDTELGDAPDRTWNIERVGFSYAGLSGLSIPWSPEFRAAVRLLLESDGEKVVWNAGFDVPRIRRAGVSINGTIHDGMVAWHILHTDLPKRLGFVATFTCPWQPAWKHLSGSRPAFYNCTDADVEWRSMEFIERELRRVGLWDVYIWDVVELEPILKHMETAGMPVDPEVRLDRVCKLDAKLKETKQVMEACIPLEARKIDHVYANTPKDTTGFLSRASTRIEPVCSNCGLARPRKDHFKRYVKKCNPCADALRAEREIPVVEWYRLGEFTPSRDQLVRYHNLMKRPLPTVYDKQRRERRVSFDERNLRKLILLYPQDPLYGIILTYRQLDKLAGTYLGRPSAD